MALPLSILSSLHYVVSGILLGIGPQTRINLSPFDTYTKLKTQPSRLWTLCLLAMSYHILYKDLWRLKYNNRKRKRLRLLFQLLWK